MNILICDRCGKQFTVEDVIAKAANESKYTIYQKHNAENRYSAAKHMDLCKNCQNCIDDILSKEFSNLPESVSVSTYIGEKVDKAERDTELEF